MAGKRAGYGRTFVGSAPPTPGGLRENLSDNALPAWDDSGSRLFDSGLERNPTTGAIETSADIITSGRVQSGVATFGLGLAHEITSAAENVTFRNTVTNITYQPTWQTTGQDGNWASVQRTPVGDLVEGHVFQGIQTETVTNPDFMFTSLPINHRLYSVEVMPSASQTNVIVTIQQNNGTEFVDYWRSRPLTLTAGTVANVAINPFIDLLAATQYRLIASSPDGDVAVLGNTAGIPRILLNYWEWADLPLATESSLGNYRFDGTAALAADVAITAANLDTYNRKIWFVTATTEVTVTLAADLNLTFFGVYVVGVGASLSLTSATGAGVRIDNETDQRYTRNYGGIFVRTTANNYHPLSENSSGVASLNRASFSANVLTLERVGSTEITATMPAATPDAAGALSGEDKTKLDSIATGAEVNVQADWNETDTTADAFIQNKPPTTGGDATTFVGLTDTPAALTAAQFLRANAAGNALEFVPAPGAANLGNYRLDDTVEITSDVTITSANRATYNLKIWLISAGSHTVTINEGSGLTFFGVYVRQQTETGTLTPAPSSNVRINNTTDSTVLDGRQSATYFEITADRFQEIQNNFRPENFLALPDTPTTYGTAGQVVAVNTAANGLVFADTAPGGDATTFVGLTDTPAALGTPRQVLRIDADGNIEWSTPGAATVTVEDGGTAINDAVSTLNFTDNITVTDGGAGEVNISASLTGAFQWTYNEISSNQPLGQATATWNRVTIDGYVERRLPTADQISAGWFARIQVDSNATSVRVHSVTPAAEFFIGPNQTRDIIWTGTAFYGLSPTQINPHTPANFTRIVISPSTNYPPGTTEATRRYGTAATEFDMNRTNPTADLLNHLIVFESTATTGFRFRIPDLNQANFTQIPRRSGYAFVNNSQAIITIDPGTDTIYSSYRTFTTSNPMALYPGAGVTLRRGGSATLIWAVASMAGTMTGGA